ncbi:MAG: sulfatase-like hydrolase/transferase, partial [Pseudomonadota bacterium]
MRNVLFVSIEDLNDFIEPLGGHPDALTPTLSRLAARSAVFDRAYATVPACSPSRSAALFGMAPWRTGIYGNAHDWRAAHPEGERLSLVGHMRDAGYATWGAGKVFHGKIDADDWDCWVDEPLDRHPPVSELVQSGAVRPGDDFGPVDPEAPLHDDRIADQLIAEMQPGVSGRFWALGIYRPHLPFLAPRRHFDRLPARVAPPPGLKGVYDPDDLSEFERLPKGARRFIKTNWSIGRALHTHQAVNAYLRAYLASVSYADEVLGRVLAALEASGLMADTTVVLWSDHGWQFGEKLAFRKFTLWERALRIPIMIAGPGISPRRIGQPVTNMDLMPTLLAHAGAAPKRPLDGRDLTPALEGDVDQAAVAVSVWGYPAFGLGTDRLAFSVRSARWRLTQYWGGGRELYDH